MPDTSGQCFGKLSNAAPALSRVIDNTLNEIRAFVFRDFVYSWHLRLIHSHSFRSKQRNECIECHECRA